MTPFLRWVSGWVGFEPLVLRGWTASIGRRLLVLLVLMMGVIAPGLVRGEALLQLFNVNWDELARRMPEIAEAGYTSLWLPPPSKAASASSVGYDLFDPFDLGDLNQRGTIRTKYGSKSELLQAVEMAHRFGLRVYFDNIMNHRGFDVPGYSSSNPTNLYPGLCPQDFHLQKLANGYHVNWPNISNWTSTWEIQNRPLLGLVDLANEPGSVNLNYGTAEGATLSKPVYIRQASHREYYMDTNLPAITGGWRPFNGQGGDPVAEDVNAYLIRSAMWLVSETKCDGFRLDAVKHTPSGFFGATSATAEGYTGGIQAMFDYVHGYGANVRTNGYVEGDDSRNSCFDTEAPRNDAMIFGEHLGAPPSFQEYLDRGMRLLNDPYHAQLNNILGNPAATLSGLDQRDYRPYSGAPTGNQSVMFAQSHDDSYASHRELHNAYNFAREGLPSIYTEGYNFATAAAGQQPFPRTANAPFLGQFGDNKMPDLAWLHNQLSRGGTRSRWSDADTVAFERYDYRETTNAFLNPDATVLLFAMNDNFSSSGDISFDDGVSQSDAGMPVPCQPVVNSRGLGLVVGFPPGSTIVQLSDGPGKDRACSRLLVRQATQILAEAQATANDPNPVNRKVYVGGQTLAPGGGAVEFKIPGGGYVFYGYQWPEPSRIGFCDAITFRQGGSVAPRMVVKRVDGVNGDPAFNPLQPFKVRGSVRQDGSIIGGQNVSNLTYAIDIPVLTNGVFDIVVQTDASATNAMVKMDGGMDLNSQMGFGTLSGLDRRDNRPGYATDVFLGYETAAFADRSGPEKFAAEDVIRNNVTSQGAETWHYTVGGSNTVINGGGNGAGIQDGTVSWAWHFPGGPVGVPGGPATQRVPLSPSAGQPVQVWVKVGYKLQANRAWIYHTVDGTNPEGSLGVGQGTTRVVAAVWMGADLAEPGVDWWMGQIPAVEAGRQVRYKIALHQNGALPISDASEAKVYGLTRFGITNFNPTSATVWVDNDLNTSSTRTGLAEGFHSVRARVFLPRVGKSSVFNTFHQTFYYDAKAPTGAVAYPTTDGEILTGASYTAVIRADETVTRVEYNIIDASPENDDAVTALAGGNGLTNGGARFVSARRVTPDAGIDSQFPGMPREFRFDYPSVASSGTAVITVRLFEDTSAIVAGRITTLVRTVQTRAPAVALSISQPSQEGAILVVVTNQTVTLQACFTSSLATTESNRFSVLVNGALQPRSGYLLQASGCAAGFRSLYHALSALAPGTNRIQVVYSNNIVLSASRSVVIARPGDSDGDGMTDYQEIIAGTNPYDPKSVLRITGIENGNQLLSWEGVANVRYQVLMTTNLAEPMAPISGLLPGQPGTMTHSDTTARQSGKYYRLKVVP